MNNDIKKLQLLNPTKLNKVLDLLSSVYEHEKFKNITNPELSDVIRPRNKLMESRRNKEDYGDTDQINFLKKLDIDKKKNGSTNNNNTADAGNNNDNDDDGGTSSTYDTQGQRGFHDSMQTKKFRKTKDGYIKLPNGKTLNIPYDNFIHDFGKNISRESMYSLRKNERQLLSRNLKKFNISTTSIRNIELQEEYTEMTPPSSSQQVVSSMQALPYLPSPLSTAPKSSVIKRIFLPLRIVFKIHFYKPKN